jgi:hypothetical protein
MLSVISGAVYLSPDPYFYAEDITDWSTLKFDQAPWGTAGIKKRGVGGRAVERLICLLATFAGADCLIAQQNLISLCGARISRTLNNLHHDRATWSTKREAPDRCRLAPPFLWLNRSCPDQC